MARIYARKKGKSGSKKPFTKKNPKWVPLNKTEIEDKVAKLAGTGLNSAQVGLKLRDAYGVPDVHLATGKTITQILREKGIKSLLPDDISALMKKAARLQAHLKMNPSDHSNKRALELTESKIRRLSKYYKREGKLPSNWIYSSKDADILAR